MGHVEPAGSEFALVCSPFALSVPTLLSAQGTTGRIVGRVADPGGAVLSNVKVDFGE